MTDRTPELPTCSDDDAASTNVDLVPCGACGRHLRLAPASCPFCGSREARSPVPRGSRGGASPGGRLTRTAVYALGVGLLSAAAPLASCTHENDTTIAPVYGGPPPDLEGPSPDAGADATPKTTRAR